MNEITNFKNIQNNVINIYKSDMTVEQIFSFTQSFLSKLPDSLDPLSDKFIPIFPIFKLPVDADKYNGRFKEDGIIYSPFDRLKQWSDTRKSAYSIRLYAQLQYMLLVNDSTLTIPETNILNNKVWGLNEKDSKEIKKVLLQLSKYASEIINSKTVEQRRINIKQTSDLIKEIAGRWSPLRDVEMYCSFGNINYDCNLDFYKYIEKQDNKRLIKK